MKRRRNGKNLSSSKSGKSMDSRMLQYDKIYVLDTNVLVHDPYAIEKFRDNIIVVPLCVIEELDKLKKDSRLGEVARNARAVSRKLRSYKTAQGSLLKGAKTDAGGLLFIDCNGADFSKLPAGLERKNDNRIILVAKNWQERYPHYKVTIVTKDANLDITADACGVAAEDYENDKVLDNIDALYSGFAELRLRPEESYVLNLLHRDDQRLPVRGLSVASECEKLHPNTCCRLLVDGTDKSALAILKKNNDVTALHLVNRKNGSADNPIAPRNDEQHLFSALLNDKEISLITCAGKAGTGKTLLALRDCYLQIDHPYSHLVIYRPLSEVGKGVGYLPGDLEEKFAHYTLPIFDNFDLMSGDHPASDNPRVRKGKLSPLRDLISEGVVEIAPFTFIRGRSLNRCLVLVDEAQNMTPHEAKTLITRAGFDSKVIMVGDPYQIDSQHLDSLSNGLSFVVERFKGQQMFGHITLTKGERSPLAELAANIL